MRAHHVILGTALLLATPASAGPFEAAEDPANPEPSLDIPALLRDLESSEENVRIGASKQLATIFPGEIQLLSPLLEGLHSKNEEVVFECACSLGRIGPEAESAIPALLVALKSRSNSAISGAVEGLRGIGASRPEAVAGLHGALSNEDQWVRFRAARALVTIGAGDEVAVGKLVSLLEAEDPHCRVMSAQVLGASGPLARGAAPVLLKHEENDPDSDVRFECWNAVLSVDRHLAGIADEIRVRLEHQLSVGVGGGGPGRVPPSAKPRRNRVRARLEHDLLDARPDVRARAAGILGLLLGWADSAEPLLGALRDKDREVRIAAARALGRRWVNQKAYLSGIGVAALDADFGVRSEAIDAVWDSFQSFRELLPVFLERFRSTKGGERVLWAFLAQKALNGHGIGWKPGLKASEGDEAARHELAGAAKEWLEAMTAVGQRERDAAVDLLRQVEVPGKGEVAARLLTDADPLQRERGLLLLASTESQPKGSETAINALYNDPDKVVRLLACHLFPR